MSRFVGFCHYNNLIHLHTERMDVDLSLARWWNYSYKKVIYWYIVLEICDITTYKNPPTAFVPVTRASKMAENPKWSQRIFPVNSDMSACERQLQVCPWVDVIPLHYDHEMELVEGGVVKDVNHHFQQTTNKHQHPSINSLYLLILYGLQGVGACPSIHWVRGQVLTGLLPVYDKADTYRQTNSFTLIFTPKW